MYFGLSYVCHVFFYNWFEQICSYFCLMQGLFIFAIFQSTSLALSFTYIFIDFCPFSEMVNLTTRLCWNLVKKEGYIAIWQKPMNNSCYLEREPGTQPPLCETNDDPDNVW